MHKTRIARPDAALCCEIGACLRRLDREQDAVSYYFAALGEDAKYAPAHAASGLFSALSGSRTARVHEGRGTKGEGRGEAMSDRPENERSPLTPRPSPPARGKTFWMIVVGLVAGAGGGAIWFASQPPTLPAAAAGSGGCAGARPARFLPRRGAEQVRNFAAPATPIRLPIPFPRLIGERKSGPPTTSSAIPRCRWTPRRWRAWPSTTRTGPRSSCPARRSSAPTPLPMRWQPTGYRMPGNPPYPG